MASFNKKKYVITAKNVGFFKKKKYAIVFASMQLWITRLRKYPIDPKAYIRRCMYQQGMSFLKSLAFHKAMNI